MQKGHQFVRTAVVVSLAFAVSLTSTIKSSALEHQPVGTTGVHRPIGTLWLINNLSPQARELAEITGILPVLTQLDVEQKSAPPTGKELSLAELSRRQKLIYLRTKLTALGQSINLQINSMRSKLEVAITQERDLRTSITEERDRMTHRNSQVNLISGGLTKMVGYSIALAPLTTIPTNVLEVFDGSVQTTLSTLSLRQQQQEKKLVHGQPEVLQLFLKNTSSAADYPSSIWTYMNRAPVSNQTGKSRRELLISLWQTNGILPAPKLVAPQSERKQPIKELLDQNLTMLADLRSVVSEMHSTLMELTDAIAATYSGDPDW